MPWYAIFEIVKWECLFQTGGCALIHNQTSSSLEADTYLTYTILPNLKVQVSHLKTCGQLMQNLPTPNKTLNTTLPLGEWY